MEPKKDSSQGKKSYTAPDLRTYGSVEQLTGQRTGVGKAHLGHNQNGDAANPFRS